MLLYTVAIAAAAVLPPATVRAQAWPSRPIKLIVPYAAGGGTDIIARSIATRLSVRIGQPVVVENKAGAGGAIGFDAGVKAPADGYTLIFITSAYATNAATGRKMAYDPVRDIAPIALVGKTSLLVAVPADSPVRTLKDLVDMARTRPDAVTYGSSGIGSMSHLGMEMLAAEAKLRFVHVPYKGMAPAFADMMGGNLQAGLATYATTSGYIAGGKLRGIAVTSAQRDPFMPQLPTAAEAGFPNFRIEFWWGFVGPSQLPRAVVQRLNEEINAILAQPEAVAALAREAAMPAPAKPEAFGRVIAADVARWSRLVKDKGIQVD
ncbi:tripartite tricarboxylate transporter substrate binding protein [Variovorax sp. YR266]|uniref:Bug family tripartite tricarboxylate transporter substrate binding protein n=1 Tax=Variovorax sp. YR266 TaxID=1884386 RepID=UPI0015A356FC|nr:tripartite tricarboxylate transporter substrate binding protein [Variovorax sp. YR266]